MAGRRTPSVPAAACSYPSDFLTRLIVHEYNRKKRNETYTDRVERYIHFNQRAIRRE